MNFNLIGGKKIKLSFFLLHYIHTEEELFSFFFFIFQQIKGTQIYYANFISIDYFRYHLYSNIVFFLHRERFLKKNVNL